MAKIKSESSGAIREIHKLLLNTLYGRMGMKAINESIKILSPKQAEELFKSNGVIDNFTINSDKEYIRYHTKPDKGLCLQSDKDYNKEYLLCADSSSTIIASSAIASATAS